MNKLKVILVGIVIVVILAWIGTNLIPNKEKGIIKIGGISALTGVGEGIGEEESKGARLAVEEINATGGINGHKLELVSEDVSIDKIKVGISVVNKLISVDKVVAIVGPQWDEPAVPILPITEEAKVVMIGPDSSPMLEATNNYNYFFSTWYDNQVGIRELLRFAKSKGLTRVAIVKPLSAGFWEYSAQIFKREAPNYGVTVVDEIDVGNPISLDFKTNILQAMKNKPEAIFMVSSDYNQCTFLKQAEQMGFKGISLGTEASGDPMSITQCPKLMENRYWSTPVQTESNKVFAEKFKTRFGEYPRFPSSAPAYDAVMVIAEGLKRSDLRGGEALQKAIAEIKNLQGAGLKSISFDKIGFVNTPEDAFEIQTVRDGNFITVKY